MRKDSYREYGKSYMVWIIFLVLILFASMMWVSIATENAAYKAAEDILEYNENNLNNLINTSKIISREARIAFLQEQAKHIASTNTLYTIVSLGLFLLSTIILLNNYSDTRKLGQRLLIAEEAAKSAQKIAELKASLSALFNNMPGMGFSKDAKTGVYLACNQEFANYAHKKTPEEVTGLTDMEIFDPITAAQFIEDDKMALSMDKPYIFYEDVSDAAGNQRQLQTTKLKYIDDTGRLCTLGLCQDITEFVRVKRENATTKEAYEKARSTGIIYTHIAQTLARGYKYLYYVNLDTDEFTEYQPDTESSRLIEVQRNYNFFEKCKIDSYMYIHPEDRANVLKALQRETLIDSLNRHKNFIITYRLMPGKDLIDDAIYVSMTVSRMEDDKRFIIIGITDINEQMKQQRAAEKIKEEHIAYERLNALTGDFICVYIVDPETEQYREYSSTSGYESLFLPKEGMNFFAESRELIRKCIYHEDLSRFLSLFSRESVFYEIEHRGVFALTYRLIINESPIYVQLKAAIVHENEGSYLIVGVNNIDADVRLEEDYARRLAIAQNKANLDALTGVKNRHSYFNQEEEINQQIEANTAANINTEFAITILDVNDLKHVNDTLGHQAGDKYIQDACKIICGIFKNSSIFRVGGDEFAVISQGADYESIDELVEKLNVHNLEALSTGGVVIACGMSKYENDTSVAPVFERADLKMYENKNELKSLKI